MPRLRRHKTTSSFRPCTQAQFLLAGPGGLFRVRCFLAGSEFCVSITERTDDFVAANFCGAQDVRIEGSLGENPNSVKLGTVQMTLTGPALHVGSFDFGGRLQLPSYAAPIRSSTRAPACPREPANSTFAVAVDQCEHLSG